MCLGALFLLAQFISIFTSAPFVPSAKTRVREMIALAGIKPGERVVDLGSGDGRIVIAAAKAGAEATGYELNPVLVLWSRFISKIRGQSSRTHFITKSYRGQDLQQFDVIFMYLLPKEMRRIESWLQQAAKHGARIVVNAFPLPLWTIDEKRGNLYRYILRDGQ